MGHLGADPEIRRTQDGRPIANMRMATSKTWRHKETGERKESTDWHTIVCFSEPLCKIIEEYLKKGSKIHVVGELRTRKWQDKDGNDRYSTEVVLSNFDGKLTMCDTKGSRPQASSESDYGSTSTRSATQEDHDRPNQSEFSEADYQQAKSGGSAPSFARDDMGDEVPFAPEWR
jgi:single-strand DNA-binding protein